MVAQTQTFAGLDQGDDHFIGSHGRIDIWRIGGGCAIPTYSARTDDDIAAVHALLQATRRAQP